MLASILAALVVGEVETCDENKTMPKGDSIPDILRRVGLLIKAVPYNDRFDGVHPCDFVTVDEEGFPSSRSVVPREGTDYQNFFSFELETQAGTRKVRQALRNPKCMLSYRDMKGRQGWLCFKGVVSFYATPEEIARMEPSARLKMRVDVRRIEVMGYNQKLHADADGWVPIVLERDGTSMKWLNVTP